MDTLSITSVYQLMAWLSERHIPYEIAGTSNMGLPLIVIRSPGKGPPGDDNRRRPRHGALGRQRGASDTGELAL